MNKKPVKVILCIAALSAAFVLTTCKSTGSGPSFREPRAFIRSMELSRISFTGVELMCRVSVENQNRFEIPFPEIAWEFYIANNFFANGNIKSNSRISARSTSTLSIPVKIGYLEMFDAYLSLVGRKNVDYKIICDAKVSLVDYGNRAWHLERNGSFPVLRAPTVAYRNLEVKNISLTRLDFELTIEVENPNNLDLTINNLSYSFVVNNSRWSGGTVSDPPRLAANKKTVVPIYFTINSLAIVRDITLLLAGNTSVPYNFSGNFSFGVDLPGLKDLGSSVNFGGMTRLKR